MNSQEIQETINKIKGMRLIDANKLFNWGEYKLLEAVKYGNETAKQQDYSYSNIMMYEVADEIYNAEVIDVISLITELQTQLEESQRREKAAIKDIEELLGQDEYLGVCWACANNEKCHKGNICIPKWRGVQEEQEKKE